MTAEANAVEEVVMTVIVQIRSLLDVCSVSTKDRRKLLGQRYSVLAVRRMIALSSLNR